MKKKKPNKITLLVADVIGFIEKIGSKFFG